MIIAVLDKGMTMIRSADLLVTTVAMTLSLPMIAARADVTRSEASDRCAARVVVQSPRESDNLRWRRDNDDDGSAMPVRDLDAGCRADRDR